MPQYWFPVSDVEEWLAAKGDLGKMTALYDTSQVSDTPTDQHIPSSQIHEQKRREQTEITHEEEDEDEAVATDVQPVMVQPPQHVLTFQWWHAVLVLLLSVLLAVVVGLYATDEPKR